MDTPTKRYLDQARLWGRNPPHLGEMEASQFPAGLPEGRLWRS